MRAADAGSRFEARDDEAAPPQPESNSMNAYFCEQTGLRIVAPGVCKAVDPKDGQDEFREAAPSEVATATTVPAVPAARATAAPASDAAPAFTRPPSPPPFGGPAPFAPAEESEPASTPTAPATPAAETTTAAPASDA